MHEPDKPDNADKTILDKTTNPMELPESEPESPEEENDYASIDDVVYEDIKLQTKSDSGPSLTTLTVPQLRVLQVNFKQIGFFWRRRARTSWESDEDMVMPNDLAGRMWELTVF